MCILVAAFFYSLATVRLSRLAANVSSLELATSKSLALAIISLGWVGISAAHHVATLPLSHAQSPSPPNIHVRSACDC